MRVTKLGTLLALSAVAAACGGVTTDLQERDGSTLPVRDGGSDSTALLTDAQGAPACEILDPQRITRGYDLPLEGTGYYPLAPNQDGSLLSVHGESVVVVTPEGATHDVFRSQLPSLHSSLWFSPAGNAFLIYEDAGTVGVFSSSGERLGTLSARQPGESVLRTDFGDSGQLVIITVGYFGLDWNTTTALEVWTLRGEVVASFAPRNALVRLAADDATLVFSEDQKLSAFRLDGSLIWELPVETNVNRRFFIGPENFDLSADGRRLIVELSNIVTVAHITDGQLLAEHPTDSGVWDVEMAPGGEWSVSTEVMPGRVTRFRNGVEFQQVILPVDYIHVVDINDYGEILVAGMDTNGPLHALMLDASGAVVLHCVGAYTAGPYLNEVFFDAAGTQVVLSWNDGLHTFRILR